MELNARAEGEKGEDLWPRIVQKVKEDNPPKS